MTITQTTATTADILDFVDEAVRTLQQDGLEPRTVLVGPEAYDALRHAIAARFHRKPGRFETYQYLTIILDPFRRDEVCVLPAPGDLVEGVRAVQY